MIELSARYANLTNLRFGRLTVVEPVRISKLACGKTRVFWRCSCQCGKTAVVANDCLRRGTKSCGCLIVEHAKRNVKKYSVTHNSYRTPEYNSWKKMKARCLSKDEITYRSYGSRGVKVCDEWLHDFLAFYKEIGPRPGPGYSVDRVDNSKGYEPGNVRWATRREQGNNRRTCRMVEIDGSTRSVSEWCRHFKHVNPDMALGRIRCGWDPVAAVSLPRGTTKEEALATTGSAT